MSDTYILDLPPDKMEGEVAVVFFFEDNRPLHGSASMLDWRLNGKLTGLIQSGTVSGRLGDTIAVRNNGKLDVDWALFLGGGKRSRLSTAVWERLLKKGIKVCRKAGFGRIAFCLDSQESVPVSQISGLAEKILAEQADSNILCLFSFDTVPVLNPGQEKQASLL